MGNWLSAHWRAVLGGGALLLPLWQGFRSLLGVVGDVDLVVSKVNDPGWLASAWSFLIDTPAYVYLPLVAIGLLLIWLDTRRFTATSHSSSRKITISDRSAAEAFLNGFARQHGLRDPMHGGEAKFDRYVAAYNSQGGTVALAVRQDMIEPPYLYVDQNDKEYGRRYDGRRYSHQDASEASEDFLRRRDAGYTLRQRTRLS